jgi:hypothetical protein
MSRRARYSLSSKLLLLTKSVRLELVNQDVGIAGNAVRYTTGANSLFQ